jgi:hypothetical protein
MASRVVPLIAGCKMAIISRAGQACTRTWPREVSIVLCASQRAVIAVMTCSAWHLLSMHHRVSASDSLILTGRAANPLAQVLQAIDEPLDLTEYNTWNILVPEGEYVTEVCPGPVLQ